MDGENTDAEMDVETTHADLCILHHRTKWIMLKKMIVFLSVLTWEGKIMTTIIKICA